MIRASLIALLLAGCASANYGERTCTATVAVHISGTSAQSGSLSISNGVARAAARPATGDVWVTGLRYRDGIRPDSDADLGHEVLHVLHHECPDIIANPDGEW